MSNPFFSLSDVARRFGIAPRVLSDLFYQRKLDDARRVVIGSQRLIPANYLPEIEAVLREAGKIEKRSTKRKN
jgi:hypothetical protein